MRTTFRPPPAAETTSASSAGRLHTRPGLSHGREGSYTGALAGALASRPDVAASPLWNANYTDFLLRVNSSPLRPPPSVDLLLFLSETAGLGHKQQSGSGRLGRRDRDERLRSRTEELRTGAALLLPSEKS